MGILNESLMNLLEALRGRGFQPAYAGFPCDVNVAYSYGCRSSCSGNSCEGDCAGSCEDSCSGSCGDSCDGSCQWGMEQHTREVQGFMKILSKTLMSKMQQMLVLLPAPAYANYANYSESMSMKCSDCSGSCSGSCSGECEYSCAGECSGMGSGY